jgi:hypothetical protein
MKYEFRPNIVIQGKELLRADWNSRRPRGAYLTDSGKIVYLYFEEYSETEVTHYETFSTPEDAWAYAKEHNQQSLEEALVNGRFETSIVLD